ncbi:MAG: lipase maturation factor family protein [Opitutus sp.]|nr:lipase maturation factor family protein [Opitutus sp.]
MPADGTVTPPSPLTLVTQDRFTIGAWLFLRLLALIHLVAFASFWTQLEGLVGPHGLLPATRYFNAVHQQIGASAYSALPSLCWWFGTGTFLHVLCAAGVALSLLLFAGIAPAICLALLWAAYLSLSCAGQIFFNFQWDALLLETTLLAIFFAPWSLRPLWRTHEPPRIGRLLIAWLLFRLMFLAGVVKLASGDPTWRDLSALTFHYETQPLPTVLGWFAHQLPAWWQRASCAGMFAIELLVPFFLFAPRSLRHNATVLTIALMIAIAFTGNYTFFNFLAIALCLVGLDDAFWRATIPPIAQVHFHVIRENVPKPRGAPRWIIGGCGAIIFYYTLVQALPAIGLKLGTPPGFQSLAHAVGPFRSLNNYGLFAVMTNPRPELIFEGSDDSRDWRAYEFPHKPGALTRRPTWVAPHQPRLDWQLWFAALGSPQQNPWVLAVCEHLLRGTPEVIGLLAENPFPQKPPRFIRVVRYEYHFTDASSRRATGQWWRRTPMDFYVPSSSLK